MQPVIWLLDDAKASHRSQLLGVAEKLGLPCTVKNIRYNRSAALANSVFGARLWHLKAESRKEIAPPWPDLVIAAGRRSAPVSLAIKRRAPAAKLVHLMWPDVAPWRFDLIAVPEHDSLSYKGPNIIRTFGAPHAHSAPPPAEELARWEAQIARLPRPRIALLIGGSGKTARYTPADFKTLGAYASAEAERLGGSLLVTSSPRTGEEAEKLIKSLLVVPHLFHSFKADVDNPYCAFLALADAIIVTGDSISMCSEAAGTGKPAYIFMPPHIAKDKSALRETLFARGMAKPHTYPIRLDWMPALLPDAAGAVADAIRKLLIRDAVAA